MIVDCVSRWILVLLMVLLACAPEELSRTSPVIKVCKDSSLEDCSDSIELGMLLSGRTHNLQFSVVNTGDGILFVERIDVLHGELVIQDYSLRVDARQSKNIHFVLTPERGEHTARIRIRSNDFSRPKLDVVFTYRGVSPEVVACPSDGLLADPGGCSPELVIRVDGVRRAEARDVTVLIKNIGAASYNLDRAVEEHQSSVLGEFSLLTSAEPGAFPPGSEYHLTLRYQPADEFDDEYSLYLFHADADMPSVAIHVRGGSFGNSPPLSRIVTLNEREADDVESRIGLPVWLDGRLSEDHEGDPLLFSWSIVSNPLGSFTELSHRETSVVQIIPDMFGDYVVRLIVKDSLGSIGKSDFIVRAMPAIQISVVAEWDGSLGDVDLHLLPQGARVFGESDCYFFQPTVDWGEAGASHDDPLLARDDDGLYGGREQIVLARPGSGEYDVYLNMFESRSSETTAVLVSILGNDHTIEYASTESTLINTCDTLHVGTISWPGGGFVGAGANWTRACFPGSGE